MSSQPPPDDDGLAYGDNYSQSRASGGPGGAGRSLFGDTLNKFKSEYDKYKTPSSQNYGYSGSGASNQAYYGQQGQSQQPYSGQGQSQQPYSGQQGQSQQPYSGQGQPQQPYPGQQGQPQQSWSGQGQSQQSYSGQQGQGTGPSQQSYFNPSGPGQNTTNYAPPGQSGYPGGPGQPGQGKPDMATKLLGTLSSTLHNIGTDVTKLMGPPGNRPPPQYSNQPPGQAGYSSYSGITPSPGQTQGPNRFDSFASEKPGNDVKWYVDGCGYFWAISQAIEGARNSIWILDWWLSPELYLRRPPSQNEQWRLDRTLQRAAQRGVKIHIIVYKEVTQALCAYFSQSGLFSLSLSTIS